MFAEEKKRNANLQIEGPGAPTTRVSTDLMGKWVGRERWARGGRLVYEEKGLVQHFFCTQLSRYAMTCSGGRCSITPKIPFSYARVRCVPLFPLE